MILIGHNLRDALQRIAAGKLHTSINQCDDPFLAWHILCTLLDIGWSYLSESLAPCRVGLSMAVSAFQPQLLDHFDQIGERRGLHFLHGAAAVDLHGVLGDPDFGGDLLVEHPGNDHEDDFTFAGRQ